MKREAPTPIRIAHIKERLIKQAAKKKITLHKHLVTVLEKQAKKPI